MSAKTKFPKSIWYIFGTEICERFGFYGLKAVLVLFLISFQKYDYETAAIIFHTFIICIYVTPFFGAILSDSYWGRYKTIYVLSIVHALGNIVVTIAALITSIDLQFQRIFTITGLILFAIGAGGIKPCVGSFGGDQFVLPDQNDHVQTFFSIYYFAVNAGSLVSTFVSPELRKSVQCFGQDTCFPLAFGLPALLMVVSIIFFVCGKKHYKMKKPVSSVVAISFGCMFHAMKKKLTASPDEPKKKDWLEYAEDKYSKNIVQDLRLALDAMVMLVPIPIYFTLSDQQGSSWVLQATLMDGKIDFLNWTFKPDQVHLINPLVILLCLPLFETVVYPLLYKIGITTPLRKITVGGMVTALSFVCAAVVQYTIMGENVTPSPSDGHLRIYNNIDCSVTVTDNVTGNFQVESLDVLQNDYAGQALDLIHISLSIDVDRSCRLKKRTLNQSVSIPKGIVSSYFLTYNQENCIELRRLNNLHKLKTGKANFRILPDDDSLDKKIILQNVDSKNNFSDISMRLSPSPFQNYEIPVGTYNLYLYPDREYVLKKVFFSPFSVNDLLLHRSINYTKAKIITFEKGKYIHILWQVPQVLILTVAEVMFVVTSLEFIFTQAPVSMKSFVSSVNLGAEAVGNLIIIMLSKLKLFENQGHEYLFYAILMTLSMVVFILLSMRYKYKCITDDQPATRRPSSNG